MKSADEWREDADGWRSMAAAFRLKAEVHEGDPSIPRFPAELRRRARLAEFEASVRDDCAHLVDLGVTDIDVDEVRAARDDRPDRELGAVRRELAEHGGPVIDATTFFLDWSEFWTRDHAEQDWLYEPVLARGRSHVIYAKHKSGKSLLALWLALELVRRRDVIVVYLDYEMSEGDLYERLVEMGVDEDTDLVRLRYALLPPLGPLDQPGVGPNTLHALVDAEREAHPDADIVVVIDSLGRAVSGAENDNDTYRAFWAHTGVGLKQRGCTTLRIDHEGKDSTRGQRGGSGKGDDPDVIWRLTPADRGGFTLKSTARMVWVPERVGLVRPDGDVLRYGVGLAPTPAGTKDLADELDALGMPSDATVRECRSALKHADQSAASNVLAAAVRYRKDRPK